jgi:hypothetical protein
MLIVVDHTALQLLPIIKIPFISTVFPEHHHPMTPRPFILIFQRA